jgi:hypothetical protein
MFSDAPSDANLIPTLVDLGLTFPVPVLSLEDASRPAGLSTGVALFLDSNDSRLIHRVFHHPATCGCARGRMVPFMGVVESLLADEG